MWLLAGGVLSWAWLSGRWRLGLALLVSVAGLVCLVVALSSEGVHEASSSSVFLIGAPYVTQQASALTSLPYYLLTGLCLLLGTAALAAGDGWARVLRERWLAVALALTFGVSLLRFALEKVAAPATLTQVFGVTWLAPVVGAYFLLVLRSQRRGWGALAWALVVYALASRAFVAGLYLAATLSHLGSHYDLSTVWSVKTPWGQMYHFVPGSLPQFQRLVLVPQLGLWPAFTLIAGLLGAVVAQLVYEARRPPTATAAPRVEVQLAHNSEA
jgi:hypothetical protein